MSDNPPKVITIPAKPGTVNVHAVQRQLRVAAYCRVSTDEEGKEFVNRLMACLEVIDEKKRIFRAAGIDLTIDSSSPLKKLMAKRGVLE